MPTLFAGHRRRQAALLLGCSLLLACKAAKSADRTRPPPSVTVAKIQVRDVSVEIRAPVELRAAEQADVGAKTVGWLDAVLVDRGDRVKKGQLVALIRPSDLPDQLAAARGVLAQTQSSVALARANKDRAERLAPSGVVSQQELDSARAALASAEASHAAAQANVSALATRLGEMRIDAPLDGLVSQRRLDPGALVGPTSNSGAILTIERIDELRVFIPVNERDVDSLRIGQDAHVELDAFPGRSYAGKVVRLSPSFDAVARTLDAEVRLKNPGELRSRMYGRGAIVTAIHKNVPVVPASAVQVSNGEYVAYVLHGDRVKRVVLKAGVDGGNWLEVVDGLTASDEIVTAGADTLSDGAVVRAVRNMDPFSGAVTAASDAR